MIHPEGTFDHPVSVQVFSQKGLSPLNRYFQNQLTHIE